MNTSTQLKPVEQDEVAQPASILAAVLRGPGEKISFAKFRKPTLAIGEVLISMIYSEVCGTDVHIQQGKLDDVPYPIIPGHFAVGTVEEVRGDQLSVSGQRICPGDVVTFLDVHGTCRRCLKCLVDKNPTKCKSRKVYGVNHSSNEGLFGGWSEKILLQNDVTITHLPKEVSPLRFIAGGCAMPTAIHAVKRGRVGLGNLVVVQGAGPVGLCAAIVAHHSGAKVILVDKSPVRLDAAQRLGFETIDFSKHTEASSVVEELSSGRKADVVIEATGVPDAISSGIAYARDGGRYVIVGHYTNAGETMINPHQDINKKHLEILGTWGVEYTHFHHALELLAQDDLAPSGVSFEDVMTSIYSLSETDRALDDVKERRVVKAVISAIDEGETE